MTRDLNAVLLRYGGGIAAYGAGLTAGVLLTAIVGWFPVLVSVVVLYALEVWRSYLERRLRRTYIEVDELVGCARCGQSHPIAFRRLEHPIPAEDGSGDYTHWAPCPTNGEPVLMRGALSFSIKLGARE